MNIPGDSKRPLVQSAPDLEHTLGEIRGNCAKENLNLKNSNSAGRDLSGGIIKPTPSFSRQGA